MAKSFVILCALFVLGVSGAPVEPQAKSEQKIRLTSEEWEQIGNTIEEIFGIPPGGEQAEGQQEASASPNERRSERMREFLDGQQRGPLEDREERNREALGRAQGRLPEREARRRGQLQQLARQKERQWEQDQLGSSAKGKTKKSSQGNYNSFPLYEFAYGVYDPETGDKKEQWEKRVGDHVQGTYSLDQPDGKTRIVEYTADDKNGFEAMVKQVKSGNRGSVKWGHSDKEVAQSYSKLKKVD